MQIHDCNFTPLKRKLKDQLIDIKKHIENVIVNLDQNSSCLLNELDLVRTKFLEAESISSTYYLNCFLFPFTSKYQEIAKSIYHLSQKNLGALIVIQREDPLDSLITPASPYLRKSRARCWNPYSFRVVRCMTGPFSFAKK